MTYYKFIKKLGCGGFGNVYLAKNQDSNYAIKVIDKRKNYNSHEKYILKLMNSPFTLKLYNDYIDCMGNQYLVTEYASKGTLSKLIMNNQILSVNKITFYLAQLVLGIDYIHSKNIIHLDIKPDNILVKKNGYLLIGDFGISEVMTSKRRYLIAGTRNFMAPECFKILNKRIGFGVDWWALGITIYIIYYGNYKNLPKSNYLPTITDHELNSVYMALLEYNPDIRVNNAQNIHRYPLFKYTEWNAIKEQKYPAPYIK